MTDAPVSSVRGSARRFAADPLQHLERCKASLGDSFRYKPDGGIVFTSPSGASSVLRAPSDQLLLNPALTTVAGAESLALKRSKMWGHAHDLLGRAVNHDLLDVHSTAMQRDLAEGLQRAEAAPFRLPIDLMPIIGSAVLNVLVPMPRRSLDQCQAMQRTQWRLVGRR